MILILLLLVFFLNSYFQDYVGFPIFHTNQEYNFQLNNFANNLGGTWLFKDQ